MKSKYNEIKNTFFDKYNQVWCIDAWYTDESEEEGKVIAEISLDGVVKYNDLDAITDELAQEKIKERIFLCYCDKVSKKMNLNFKTGYINSDYETEVYLPYFVCEAQIFNETLYFIYNLELNTMESDEHGFNYCSSDYNEIQRITDKLNGISDERDRENTLEELKLDWVHSIMPEFTSEILKLLNLYYPFDKDELEKISEACFEYLSKNALK